MCHECFMSEMFALFTATAQRFNCRPFVEHQVSAAERSLPALGSVVLLTAIGRLCRAESLFSASLCFECRMTLYRGAL